MSDVEIQATVEEVETKAVATSEKALSFRVQDQVTYELAGRLLQEEICPRKDEVHEAFDSIVDAAYRTWKEACAKRKKYLDPLEAAETHIKSEIGQYELAQQRLAEQRRLEAQKVAEQQHAEQLEVAIEQAEMEGATPEEVRAILEEPMVIQRVTVAPPVQRVAGITGARVYKAEVRDIVKLARAVGEGKVGSNCIKGNEAALNALARAHKTELSRFVPGVVAVEDITVRVQRKK